MKKLLKYARSAGVRSIWRLLGIAALWVFFASNLQADVLITVNSQLPGGTVNTTYSVPLSCVLTPDTPATCSWTLMGNSMLPAGLNLSPTGAITGTPTASGTFSFTVRAALLMMPDTKTLTITIAQALSVANTSLAGATQNTPYSQTLMANGGTAPFNWSVIGSLPAGLSINSSTGVISGTPSTTGTFNFVAVVKDSANFSGATATQPLTIMVVAPPVITTTSLPGGVAGAPYSTSVMLTGGSAPISWSVIAGGLPSGLGLNSGTGVISGTTSAIGNSAFTVKATDNAGASDSKALSITIAPQLSIATTSLPAGTALTLYSTTAVSSGGTPPFTWSVPVGSLPAGLTPTPGTGVISGTPTAAAVGTSNFLLQVTDSGNPAQSVSRPLSITIAPALTVTTVSFPGGTAAAAYSTTATNSGGVAPFSWSITGGSLPSGLTLTASTGVISGTPSTTGTANFTIRVADSVGASASKALSMTIAGPPAVTTTTLPAATVGSSYSQTLQSTGGTAPFAWSVISGAIPAGLNLTSGTGVISGTPSTEGTFSFIVRVADSNGATALSPGLSIVVAPRLTINTTTLSGGTVGITYSTVVARSGGTGPFTWTVASGNLPAGIGVTSGTGELSGVPTSSGTFNFTLTVTDSVGATSSGTLSLVIAPAPAITSTSLSGGTLGFAYSQTIASTGGTAPLNWTIAAGALPVGLSLNPGTGAISGTPTVLGNSDITFRVTDSVGATASKQLSILISVVPTITSTTLPAGTALSAYSATLTTSGGTTPFTWIVTTGSLPAGLSLQTAGVITGTPSAAGTSNFTVRVTDAAGAAASQALSVTIAPPLVVSSATLPDATVGQAYSATLNRTGGVAPYTWSVSGGALPAGMSLDANAGIISGTPSTAGTANFTARVADAAGASATRTLSIGVGTPVTITTSVLPAGTAGTAYSATLAASGGTAPYSWSVPVGLLPAGLTLNATTGTISGTPSAAGSENFQVQAADSASPARTKVQAFSIVIAPALAITTTSPLQSGTSGIAYAQTLTATGGTAPYNWTITSGVLPPGLNLNAGSGLISGTPSLPGGGTFTVRVVDSANSTPASQAFSISIASPSGGSPPLSISNGATLPGGLTGVEYSQSLNAVSGLLPFSWSVITGALPSGLSLNSSGVISGTPSTAGTFNFTAQVRDAGTPGQTATKAMSLTILQALAINTASLPDAVAGSGYLTTLTASGGTSPYRWAVTAGTLPTGFNLNTNTGTISGATIPTGTFSARITVTDALSATASKTFTINVSFPQIDSNVLATIKTAQQLPFSPSLRSTYPNDITGEITLTFTPNPAVANVVSGDPLPEFSNGTRTVSFSIPANTTSLIMSPAPLLLSGTVAGTIRVTASILGGPGNMSIGNSDILPESPQITGVEATLAGSVITIRTTGYSDIRSMTSVSFSFDVRTNSGTQKVNLTRAVDGDFADWYQKPGSGAFGSAFLFVQSFNIQGDASLIDAVTVTLTNSQGTTTSSRTVLTH